MNTIVIKSLSKKYGGTAAVDNLNLSIEQGELFSLLGVNGAGKTTTIKMLSCSVSAIKATLSGDFPAILPHIAIVFAYAAFIYLIAVFVFKKGEPLADTAWAIEEIPAHTYIAFTCTGKMPDAFVRLYRHIYTELFLTSEYKPAGGIDFEVYPSADVANPNYTCEFWIAVEKAGRP